MRKPSQAMMTYYEVRYDKLIEELRQIAAILNRPNPIMTRKERQFVNQRSRLNQVDVIGAE